MSGGDPGSRLFDAGLQPERTALAWRRTALSVLAGSAAGARLLAPQFGALGVVLGVAGCAVGVWTYLAAGGRARRQARELSTRGELSAGPGAAVPALVAFFCVLLGVFSLWLVLGHGLVVS